MTDKKPVYPEENIQLLNLREHVRLRPGMYVGGPGLTALHNLINIILDDAIDEILAGHGNHIWITFRANQEVSIRHNGRGISANIERGNKSYLEIMMTESGVLRVKGDYLLTSSIHGSICFFAVNALSAECKVESYCDGYLWQQSYQEGITQSEVIQVRQLGDDEATGVSITFQPDFTIFEAKAFDYEILAERARDLAYLIPNLTLTLVDERANDTRIDEFHLPNGLLDVVANLDKDKSVIYGPKVRQAEWTISKKDGGQQTLCVDVILQYNDSMETQIVGFIDLVKTSGGLHTDVIPLALTATANHLTTHLRLEKPLSFEEIAPGLTIVVHLKYPSSYHIQEYLGLLLPAPDVCGIVADTIHRFFHPYSGDKKNDPVVQKWLANRQTLQKG